MPIVIQAFFAGGKAPTPARLHGVCMSRATAIPCQPKATVERRGPFSNPQLIRPASPLLQANGALGKVEIDPVKIGLVRGGGQPLPMPVLAKMESAFGANFKNIKIHIGPQPQRIGALAFTTGNDIYFAPGQYQPGSRLGQQLIGHELAHVIQQRQGRVRAPGTGIAVVHDAALEAEADRLGMRAAAAMTPATRSTPGIAATPGRPLQAFASAKVPSGLARGVVQRMLVALVDNSWAKKKQDTILKRKKALGKAQQLGTVTNVITNIANLNENDPLWLFSHGSATSFAGLTAKELVDLLISAGLPAGKREIVLKACKSGPMATAVQELLRSRAGYDQVTVTGMPGVASQTSSQGLMTVKTTKSIKDGKAAGALAHLLAMREGRSRDEADEVKSAVAASSSKVDVLKTSEGFVAATASGKRAIRRAIAKTQTPYSRPPTIRPAADASADTSMTAASTPVTQPSAPVNN